MVDSESLARYIADTSGELIRERDSHGKNSMVPKPPPSGKYIICQHCGKPMLPEDFSKDKETRKKEFKWQMHMKCMEALLDECDRMTPGLLADRASGKVESGRRI